MNPARPVKTWMLVLLRVCMCASWWPIAWAMSPRPIGAFVAASCSWLLTVFSANRFGRLQVRDEEREHVAELYAQLERKRAAFYASVGEEKQRFVRLSVTASSDEAASYKRGFDDGVKHAANEKRIL